MRPPFLTKCFDIHSKWQDDINNNVNDFLSIPIQNTTELKLAIERINVNKKKIESKITSALKKSNTYLKNDSLTSPLFYTITITPCIILDVFSPVKEDYK